MNDLCEPGEGRLRVAVIGAGPAGRSFTRRLLQCGLAVTLEDVLPSKLRRAADEVKAEAGLSQGLELVSTVEDAVRDADLAIDFVPDELESKLEILSMMDRMAPPRTIFLTPTETLSIADLASCTYRPERCFGLCGLLQEMPPQGGAELGVLHPEGADKMALEQVCGLLKAIGVRFAIRLDPFPSLLTGR